MGRTACTEPQCLYKGALYFTFTLLNVHHTKYNNQSPTLYDGKDIVKEIKKEDLGGWGTSVECKKWILAETLLILKQKALDV